MQSFAVGTENISNKGCYLNGVVSAWFYVMDPTQQIKEIIFHFFIPSIVYIE